MTSPDAGGADTLTQVGILSRVRRWSISESSCQPIRTACLAPVSRPCTHAVIVVTRSRSWASATCPRHVPVAECRRGTSTASAQTGSAAARHDGQESAAGHTVRHAATRSGRSSASRKTPGSGPPAAASEAADAAKSCAGCGVVIQPQSAFEWPVGSSPDRRLRRRRRLIGRPSAVSIGANRPRIGRLSAVVNAALDPAAVSV